VNKQAFSVLKLSAEEKQTMLQFESWNAEYWMKTRDYTRCNYFLSLIFHHCFW
jgi:hypothetical protein